MHHRSHMKYTWITYAATLYSALYRPQHTYEFQRFGIAFFVAGGCRYLKIRMRPNDTHTRVDWHQFDTMAICHYSFLYKIAARLINWRPFRLGSAYVLRLTGYAWNWYIIIHRWMNQWEGNIFLISPHCVLFHRIKTQREKNCWATTTTPNGKWILVSAQSAQSRAHPRIVGCGNHMHTHT